MQSETLTKPPRKYPCPDCKMCQGCAEHRCIACRDGRAAQKKKKLSTQEQIELYNRLNPQFCCSETHPGCMCGHDAGARSNE